MLSSIKIKSNTQILKIINTQILLTKSWHTDFESLFIQITIVDDFWLPITFEELKDFNDDGIKICQPNL